jgi:ABC-2 type transport system permease protein
VSLRRVLAIAGNDLALLRQDPFVPILLVAMPIAVMAFVRPAFAPALRSEGYPAANGAEQAVPGIALMFVFFMVTFAALGFFREHIWGTWDRLRSMPVRDGEILVSKVVVPFTVIAAQQAMLFTVGALLFGLRIRGSVAALAAVDLAFTIWLTAFCVATVAVCTTIQQVLAVSNLGAIVCAGIGGALTPISTLPGWIHTIAHVTPDYWAMRGFNSVLLDGRSFAAVLLPIGLLLGSAVLLALTAAARFRFDARKGGMM